MRDIAKVTKKMHLDGTWLKENLNLIVRLKEHTNEMTPNNIFLYPQTSVSYSAIIREASSYIRWEVQQMKLDNVLWVRDF